MTLPLVIFLLALGLILVIVEILLIPGTSIAGIFGLLLLGFGIWASYAYLGTNTANITVISTVAISIITIYFSLKSKTWRKAVLHNEINSKVEFNDITKLMVGDEGITLSRLASIGKADFNGKIYEVCAFTGLIEADKRIKIVKIEDNKIYVINK